MGTYLRTQNQKVWELINTTRVKTNIEENISINDVLRNVGYHFSFNFLVMANAAPTKATTMPEIMIADFSFSKHSFFSISFFFCLAAACSFNQ